MPVLASIIVSYVLNECKQLRNNMLVYQYIGAVQLLKLVYNSCCSVSAKNWPIGASLQKILAVTVVILGCYEPISDDNLVFSMNFPLVYLTLTLVYVLIHCL